jgi:hypothetical protein
MTLAVTPGTPSGLSWKGQPLEVWGVRVASGAAGDRWTQALIDNLDEYKAHGVNTLTVFYQGSSGAWMQGFSEDGREIDPDVRRRMDRLIDATAEREMFLVAGIFYQRSMLPTREAYLRAAEAVGRHVAGRPHVLVNVVNENSGRQWREACPFPAATAEGIAELCRTVRQHARGTLVGGGGIHPGVNAEISVHPDVDVVFFDWHGASQPAVEAYRAAGSDKPLMNVEVFGGQGQGWSEEDDVPRHGHNVSWPLWRGNGDSAPGGRRRVQGAFPEGAMEGTHHGKADYLAEIEYAARTTGHSLFGHFAGWYQGPSRDAAFDNRFDLGGQGTHDDPGIRWYFEAVRRASGRTRRW